MPLRFPASESVKLGAGNTKIWQLPKTWKGRIEGYRVNVIGDDTQLFRQELCAPPNGCYKTYGTIFDSQWSNNCD